MPNKNDDLYQAAQIAIHQGQYEHAYHSLMSILSSDKNFVDAYFLLARIAGEYKNHRKEQELLEKACSLDAQNSEYFAALAKSHAIQGEMNNAFLLAEHAAKMENHNAMSADTLGIVYGRLSLHEEASKWFLRATDIEKSNPGIYFNLGSTLKFCGDFEGARRAFEQAISLNFTFYKAHAALTSLGGITLENNHVGTLKFLLHGITNDDDYLYISHALSKELEAVKRYPESFSALTAGKQRKLNNINYQFPDDAQTFAALENHFANKELNSASGYSHKGSIFVVGMPRSGTTLVERIISSHSKAATAGELHSIPVIVKSLLNNQSDTLVDKALIASADKLDYELVGKTYIQNTQHLNKGKEFLVDKLPLNALYAGFIINALPEAKVICLDRNPLDTIVSNYRQLFSFHDVTYAYSLSLASAAHYYVGFKKLMNFWAAKYPKNFYVINYENLVSSPETEVKKLLEFCGLEWEPACLLIENNKNPVATASSVQVRKPISDTSVGQWKLYDEFLDEAKQILLASGITFE